MKKQKTIELVLVIIVVIVSGFSGWLLAIKQSESNEIEDIDGLVVNIKDGIDYSAKLIITYNEYVNLLNENEINLEEKNILTEADFNEHDYIIDYIPYDQDLKITGDIGVEILEGGVEITYPLNHEVESSDKLLLYVIPLEKNLILNFNLANRIFDYDDKN